MLCARDGCDREALEGSIHCVNHRPKRDPVYKSRSSSTGHYKSSRRGKKASKAAKKR